MEQEPDWLHFPMKSRHLALTDIKPCTKSTTHSIIAAAKNCGRCRVPAPTQTEKEKRRYDAAHTRHMSLPP
jgi:hypothetical protein